MPIELRPSMKHGLTMTNHGTKMAIEDIVHGTDVAPLPRPRRWREHRIPVGEYAIVSETYGDTMKTVYHLLVNGFQSHALMTLAEELQESFDPQRVGKCIQPIPVNPIEYGLETTKGQPWHLYRYVTKGDEELRSSKLYGIAVRCVYWENSESRYAKQGVALTGMRSIPMELLNDTQDKPRPPPERVLI